MSTNERERFEALMKEGGFFVKMLGNGYLDVDVQRMRAVWLKALAEHEPEVALRARLQEIANKSVCDPAVYDDMDGGGNSHVEVHRIGYDDGQIELARELLAEFFSEGE